MIRADFGALLDIVNCHQLRDLFQKPCVVQHGKKTYALGSVTQRTAEAPSMRLSPPRAGFDVFALDRLGGSLRNSPARIAAVHIAGAEERIVAINTRRAEARVINGTRPRRRVKRIKEGSRGRVEVTAARFAYVASVDLHCALAVGRIATTAALRESYAT